MCVFCWYGVYVCIYIYMYMCVCVKGTERFRGGVVQEVLVVGYMREGGREGGGSGEKKEGRKERKKERCG